MRNVSKNKFLLCFRPVVDIDATLESKVAVDCSASCRLACLPVSDKHEMKNSDTKSMTFHQGSTNFTENWIMQQPPKRSLSRVFRAVVFETILNRRARHKNRYRHDSFRSKRSSSTSTETKAPVSHLRSSSSYDSASFSSSMPVSESKNLSKYCSTKEKHKEISDEDQLERQNKFEFYGIYLVLISLALTVFCGKIFGIILTSIWLTLFSLWNPSLTGCGRQSQRSTRIGVIMEDWKVYSKGTSTLMGIKFLT